MSQVLSGLVRMWVLRATPQDLPVSKILTYVLLASFAGISIASMFNEFGLERAIFASLIDTALLIAPVIVLIAISGKSAVAYQTVSAILATSIVLVVVLVLSGLFVSSQRSLDSARLVVLIWYLVIFGHVLRQAVRLPVVLGAAFAFIYIMVSNGLINALFTGASRTIG